MRPGETVVGERAGLQHSTRNHAGTNHSTWHSPVPYLFGGLAAMLGLIAMALLILACSYWRISGYLDGGGDAVPAAEGSTEKARDCRSNPSPEVYEESLVVIMAGEWKPRYLATPVSGRGSSFGDQTSGTAAAAVVVEGCDVDSENGSGEVGGVVPKAGGGNRVDNRRQSTQPE
ncbi:hypothetical protein HPP92_010262 [Vanilla planifolia]|uniref:Uncharacterized protein n=1 Tax=Vanilla planifolia TaxID=51239 RepID=A0A835R983_VANPL|nr:hypothetical protein HPP92_010262 [Vanilla planifolia]